jgi:acyl-CoA synthetase (AMP-forming)/AMP-acid ligase II
MQKLAATLQEACQRWPERPALTSGKSALTYRELWERVARLATAYRALGIGPGDRIVCQLPTSPEHLISANAAWHAGAIHVGAHHDLTGQELSQLVGIVGAAALLLRPQAGHADPLAPIRAVARASPGTRIIVDAAMPETDSYPTLSSLLSGPGGRGPAPGLDTASDPALLFLTSGTTGPPKCVVETLPALWAKLAYFSEAIAPGPDDVHLMYLPICHAFGFKLSMTALLSGGRVVLMDRFSPEDALGLIGGEGVTVLPGTPTHFQILLSRFDPGRHPTHTLRWAVSAASPLPPGLPERLYDMFGVELFHVYGCSEGFLVSTTDHAEILRGSAGRRVFTSLPDASPTGTVAVLDAAGNELPPGEVGEIAFGTARPVRYWELPSAGCDGWYRTGDLGILDPDGCLHVVGRLKDCLNRGGLKVAPGEVERHLVAHPDVADGAVVGTPDRVLGEAICACVVPANGASPTLSSIRRFLGASLARHKLPDELLVLPEIPRTPIGKVDRATLLELALAPGSRRERARA